MRRLLLVLACLSGPAPTEAGPAAAAFGVRVWQTDDGLPRNSVQAIAQTPDGYLWIGTQRGLVRFDGVRFTAGLADRALAAHAARHSVRALLVTRDGSLWIGLDGGGLLERRRDGGVRQHDLADLGLYVRALAQLRDGSVVAGTSAGLTRLVAGRWQRLPASGRLPRGAIYAIHEDRGGHLWVGTNEGLVRIAGAAHHAYTTRDGLAHDAVWAIEQDEAGSIWAGTRDGLSRRLDAAPRATFSRALAGDRIRALHVDRDGRLWIGTDRGLHQARDGRVLEEPPGARPIAATVFCLFEDREGTLWAGTNAGLYRLRPGRFGALTVDDGLPHNVILPVLEDRRGAVWMGTWGGGLVRRHQGRFATITSRHGLPDDRVYVLLEDRRGAIWAGTETGVARSRDHARFERVTALDAGATGRALVLYEDRRGAVWMGTHRGLFRIEEAGATPVPLGGAASPVQDAGVQALVEDERRTLWVATGSQLFALDDPQRASGRLVHTAPAPIRALHLDARGVLWLAIAGGGLVRLHDGRAFRFEAAHGLPAEDILAILPDGGDRFWFSTKRGLTRVRQQELDEVAAGRAPAVLAAAYGARDGMPSTECTGDASPAAWRRRDGTLWFPTTRGVVVVDSAALALNVSPPPVAIEEVLHGHLPLDPAGPLALAPGRGDLELRYTALSFVAPEKIRFHHRLEGHDPDWVDAGPRRAAFYTNLPPGDYRFLVRASNEDGVWSEAVASVGITVQPHVYQTWGFLLGCLGACGLTVWAAYAVRMRQMTMRLAAVKAERNRMAREIHDTLLQGVAGIGYQLEAVRHRLRAEPEAAEQQLDRVAGHVDACLGEARRSVRNMRSQWLERHDLAAALLDAGRLLVDGTGIELRVDVLGPLRPLESDVEYQCLRIGQEAMVNAVTHAAPTRIDVLLHFQRRRVQLVVADDGCGFDWGRLDAGDQRFGLVGIAERARQLGGRVRIDSRAGHGTRVVLDVPTAGWPALVRTWRRRGRADVLGPQPGEDLG